MRGRETASDLGVSISTIGDTHRPLVAAEAISVWNNPDGEIFDVMVRLLETGRRDAAAQLSDLTLSTGRTEDNGKSIIVLLNQVVETMGRR